MDRVFRVYRSKQTSLARDFETYDRTPVTEVLVLELEQSDKVDFSSTDKDKLHMVSNRTNELKRKIKSIVPCNMNKTSSTS